MVVEGRDAPHPPFTPDLLADLHGGVLPDDEAARLRSAVAADPDARAVLAAFDRVRSDLAALRTDPAPAPAAPEAVMTRIRAALDAAEAPAPVTDLAARRRRLSIGFAAAAAALAVLGGVGVAALRTGAQDVPPDESVLAHPATVDLGDNLPPAALLGVVGHSEPGAYADADRRGECLRANGIDASSPILGSTTVTLRGTAGVLLLLPGPTPPTITALVVGNSCSATNPDTIARTDIG
ncbi:hypothetical protein [Rhodococcus triatomae]